VTKSWRELSGIRKGTAVLVGGINAEPRQIRDLKGKIAFQEFFKILPLFVIHDVVDHVMDIFVVHWRHIDAADIAIDPDHRRETGR
jgi:hypothetical protein